MEFKRVFNKKRLVVLLLLFIVNGIFFLRECSDLKMYDIYDTLVLEINKKEESAVDVRKTALSVLKEYAEVYSDSTEYEEYLKARRYLLEKVDYLENYSKNKTQQIENSKVVLSSSLFSDKNSFSYLNIIKTTKDLEAIKDAQITLSNGIWLEKVSNYKMIYYFIMIGVVMIVYSFVEDRKTKIIYLQYAASNGRESLFLKRIIIFLGMIFLITILFFTETSIISLYLYGGFEGINDSVCSDELFAICSMGGASRITWIVINVLRIAIAFGAIGMCVWAVLTSFNNSNIGLCVFILVYGIEVMLNRIITDKSIFRFFKFFNLKYLIDGSDSWFTYSNWGYNNIITDMAESTGILIIFVSIISIVLLVRNCILYNPLTQVGFLEKSLIRIYDCVMKFFAKLPVGIMEIFKVVVSQRIGIVLIIIVILFTNMNKGYVLKYSIEMSLISNLCESYKMGTTEDLLVVKDELIREMEVYEGDVTAISKVSLIEAQIEHLDYIIQKRREGVNVSLISPYEYEAALGKNQVSNQQFISMLCIIVMILTNIGAVSYEKKCGMLCNIRVTKNRMSWIKNKILCNALFATIVVMILYGWYYYTLVKLYDLTDFNVSVQSLTMFANYALDISIMGFVILDLLLKIIVLIAIGGIAFTISASFNYDIGYFIGLIMILPHLLYELGVDILSYISLPKMMAFMPFWLEGRVTYNLIADIIIIIIGVLGYIYASYCIVTK